MKEMNFFGFRIVRFDKGLDLKFEKKPVGWERTASKLIKDGVILDVEKARDFVKLKGDATIYKVFNLWKFVDNVKKISRKTKIACDLTLLKQGIFSVSDRGESFSTYGHMHKKKFGEAYSVLKNDCILTLSDAKETFIIFLKEKSSILIHPKFMHRLISHKKDSLIINFVPKEAGHSYKIIKGKGFPFHVFYDKNRIKIRRNEKYEKGKFRVVKKFRSKLEPIELFKKYPEKLKKILENPELYENLYFTEK